ncbi:Uncharacterised protein [Xylophilus ampelinus]|nr:Uncharacterised protein [Xylophilus ampelinus]
MRQHGRGGAQGRELRDRPCRSRGRDGLPRPRHGSGLFACTRLVGRRPGCRALWAGDGGRGRCGHRRNGDVWRRPLLRRRTRQAQPLPEGRHRRRPPFRQHGQRCVHRAEQFRAVRRPQRRLPAQRQPGVVEHAHGGRRRRAAGERIVHHARQRVEVGPGPLGAGRPVLLDGREAGLEQRRQHLRAVGNHAPGGAEVQQHRAVGREEDVVGRDVAVEAVGRVQDLQRIEQRRQPFAHQPLRRRAAQGVQRRLQRRPAVEGHRHVRGAVGLPEAEHLDQGAVVEAGQQPRLVDEARQPHAEGLRRLARPHGELQRVGGARHQRRRQVFLDRHMPLERHIPRPVDDAEAALPQHLLDVEARDVVADRQCQPVQRQRRGRIACDVLHRDGEGLGRALRQRRDAAAAEGRGGAVLGLALRAGDGRQHGGCRGGHPEGAFAVQPAIRGHRSRASRRPHTGADLRSARIEAAR